MENKIKAKNFSKAIDNSRLRGFEFKEDEKEKRLKIIENEQMEMVKLIKIMSKEIILLKLDMNRLKNTIDYYDCNKDMKK